MSSDFQMLCVIPSLSLSLTGQASVESLPHASPREGAQGDSPQSGGAGQLTNPVWCSHGAAPGCDGQGQGRQRWPLGRGDFPGEALQLGPQGRMRWGMGEEGILEKVSKVRSSRGDRDRDRGQVGGRRWWGET